MIIFIANDPVECSTSFAAVHAAPLLCADYKCNALCFRVHLLAGYADAALLKGNRTVHSVDGPAHATKEKASMAETQAIGFCLWRKSSQVKLILSPKQRAKPKTSARKTGSSMPHCVASTYRDSEPMCVMPLQMNNMR
jgi:hypothetical protein